MTFRLIEALISDIMLFWQQSTVCYLFAESFNVFSMTKFAFHYPKCVVKQRTPKLNVTKEKEIETLSLIDSLCYIEWPCTRNLEL